jgi:hypothetical protein
MAKGRLPEEWAPIASEHIVSCTGCCSVFEGDYIFDGDRTGVRDFLLWSMEVPEKKVEAVAALLKCSNCHGSIDEWDDIGVKPNYQVEEDAAVEYATRRWGKKLTDFAAFLATYPMLGATHPVGKRILQEIDKFRKLTLPEACGSVAGGSTLPAENLRRMTCECRTRAPWPSAWVDSIITVNRIGIWQSMREPPLKKRWIPVKH